MPTMISNPKSIPVWYIEMKIHEAHEKSEMEYRDNGGYLDGNNYFYQYEALQGLIDDYEEYLCEKKRTNR